MSTEELERLATLHAKGALSDNEFSAAKQRVLSGKASPTIPPSQPEQQKKAGGSNGLKVLGVIALVLVGAFLMGAFVEESPEAKQQRIAEGAIELCWKDQQKKSNDPSMARFIASACEMMESDYKAKYGREP
ncbi:SHOCT domain-containing protein [Achromobacter denitrificans]